jgi:hypothetical protein
MFDEISFVTQNYPSLNYRSTNAHAKRLPLGFVQVGIWGN